MKFPDVSQGGEANFLFDHFRHLHVQDRLLVDVGAYGKFVSNTWNLMMEGWKGLLIEANPQRKPVIEEEFAGTSFTLLNHAVGNANTTAKLLMHDRVGSSSFKPDWEPEGFKGETIDVPVRVFAEVLREQGVPRDFPLLCVDTEGMDKEIVDGLLKSEFRPWVIVVELMSFGKEQDAGRYFYPKGYRKMKCFERGNPYGNIMFGR